MARIDGKWAGIPKDGHRRTINKKRDTMAKRAPQPGSNAWHKGIEKKVAARVVADLAQFREHQDNMAQEYRKLARWLKTERGKHTAMVYMKLNEMGSYNDSRLKRLKWLEKHLK